MPLPAAMLQRARDFTGPPAPARPAATVVLLRPAVEAFEVYVLRRATTMVFGGVHAFPGGGVDRNDLLQTIKQDWSERLGVPEAEAKQATPALDPNNADYGSSITAIGYGTTEPGGNDDGSRRR